MALAETVTATLASNPILSEVQAAAAAFVAKVEAALPAADRSTFETLFTATLGEVASLASGDPTAAEKLRADVKTVLGRVGHLFGSVARDVADAVDPAKTTAAAPAAPAQAAASAAPGQPAAK